ncbi:glycosyltransferase [Herbiconiux sp. CPCC 203407]|uniref:Glycosyltransferase n=1 Tax=Herbiconiux oxytropis TaxID=2970915 RepID=A0AA41XER4_9MICO|nr:glycosyltransferase [Herbiconiux oxytropis]MCS5723064.1 glycosyltransferase [Herbiconiux oxytropis]MCS5726867.1 glycosyltransferase [Herbiconiux oxytropis]
MTTATPPTPPGGRTVPGNDWSVLDGQVPVEPPRVSVVVVHFEQHDDLVRTLAALAAQSHPADRLEVVVVDDGSATPPSVPPGVTLLVQEDRGFRAAAARNAGVAASTGSVLCFLDADTAPEPGYVEALTRLPALAPEAVTVGRRRHADLAPFAGGGASVAQAAAGRELPEPEWLSEAYDRSRDLLDADERSYRHLIGAVLCCSRWFFDEIGGFDEAFVEYGGEDWDWAHRAWLAGAVFAHVPEAVAWHNGPDAALRDADPVRVGAKKNAETLALLPRITAPGATGRGVASARPDVVVLLPEGDPAAVYRTADTLLRALPTAVLVTADEASARLLGHDSRITGDRSGAVGSARTVIEVPSAFGVAEADSEHFGRLLTEASARVGRGTLGTVELVSPRAPFALTLMSTRRLSRLRRWGADTGWRTEQLQAPFVALDPHADLAAYLGGWGDPA